MTDTDFIGKAAVVTGAGGTLCSVVASDLAARGARVALIGRTRDKLDAVAQKIRGQGGKAVVAPADVTDRHAVDTARRSIEAEIGPCDLLVNGAGGNQAPAVTTLDAYDPRELDAPSGGELRGFFNLDLDPFADVLRINTMGTVIPCQVFGRAMAERGSGAILNFASMNTYRPLTRNAAYSQAKAAVSNFTQWLAAYLAPAGIRVNAVAPGFFANERSRRILMTDDGGYTPRGQNVMHHTPMKRFGEPEDLLGCVRWLLDDRASAFVTGITVPVDGGFLASSGV
jgi:NAD(P)-dependent dehydrogenase (short-subunit alcohol dehydrogenase family)